MKKIIQLFDYVVGIGQDAARNAPNTTLKMRICYYERNKFGGYDSHTNVFHFWDNIKQIFNSKYVSIWYVGPYISIYKPKTMFYYMDGKAHFHDPLPPYSKNSPRKITK